MNIVYPPFEADLWFALRPEEAAMYKMMAFDFACRRGCLPPNTYDLTGEMGFEFGNQPYPDIVFVASGGYDNYYASFLANERNYMTGVNEDVNYWIPKDREKYYQIIGFDPAMPNAIPVEREPLIDWPTPKARRTILIPRSIFHSRPLPLP